MQKGFFRWEVIRGGGGAYLSVRAYSRIYGTWFFQRPHGP